MKPRCSLFVAHAAFGALLCLSSDALAGGVCIVDSTGTRNFPDIQSAIDSAVDGDVLLVGAGSYPGFTLDGKSLAILSVRAGAQGVNLSGAIEVRNVNAASHVVLAGFSVSSSAHPLLRIHDNTGYVVVQDCGFSGQTTALPFSQEYFVAEIRNSSHVTLGRCTFSGARGGWAHFVSWNGESGMLASSSSVAAYGCVFGGGAGGDGYECPGAGGTGLRAQDSRLFAAGSSFSGGNGGQGTGDAYGYTCGDGGSGLDVGSGSIARLLGVATSAGSAGYGAYDCWDGNCSNGSAISGQAELLPGVVRAFASPWLCVDRAPWTATVSGEPGDQVFLNRSFAPVFQYEPAFSGVCTSRLPPFPAVAPLGVVPASGSLALAVPQRLLPEDVVARLYFLQGYVTDPAGVTSLASPLHVLSLNWSSLPDCNGNGINDYAEVILGISPDANHDLKPDGCP